MNKELELWHFIAERLKANQDVMLLVVVESSGSSPGRQGFKMAVASSGDLIGSIGGGVMEVDLVEESRKILASSSSHADVLTQPVRDQVHRQNVPNSSGMICSGKQTVIFKQLTHSDVKAVGSAVNSLKSSEPDILEITPNSFSVMPPGGASDSSDFAFERYSETYFVYREKLGRKNKLYIIGGGHCALALSELMSKMDFYIHLFDDRPHLITIRKNQFVDEISVIDGYERIGDHIEPSENAYVVVMTLGYKTDKVVMEQLVDKDFKYFGVLGSEAKMATVLRELEQEGVARKRLDLIHTPVGLRINSRSPEEIAVSIAAQIIAVKNGAML